jgi:hypothetical protein
MTTDHEASRTLVKSPPELWAECSDAGSLARHLGEFGEIRITRLEPEIIVAWEGERASGTVRIEPSGWGTKVTLTAKTEAEEEPEAARVAAAPEPPVALDPPVAPEPPIAPEPQPEPVVAQRPAPIAVTPAPRGGLWSRLFGRRGAPEAFPAVAVSVAKPEPAVPRLPRKPEPVLVSEPEPEPEPVPEAVAEPEPVPEGPDAAAVLAAALESLGQAHHRPFSRS